MLRSEQPQKKAPAAHRIQDRPAPDALGRNVPRPRQSQSPRDIGEVVVLFAATGVNESFDCSQRIDRPGHLPHQRAVLYHRMLLPGKDRVI